MANLFIMMGAPGAGKSTFIKNVLSSRAFVVSRDVIRFGMVKEGEQYFSKEKDVYKEYIRQINENLNSGWDTVADATHLNRASRNKLLNCIQVPNVEIHLIWFKTSLETCLQRNENRAGTRAYVPSSVITKMHNSIERPEFEEGIDVIYIYEENKTPVIIRKGD
jgi:predicted kinase